MTPDRLAQAVRHQLGLGRLLPLGDAADGTWLVEKAAVGVLRSAASRALPNLRMGALRISPASPESAAAPAVPAPATALPPGPLLVEGDFAAPPDAPLPTVAELLRTALLDAAEQELGLRVTRVDLHVTGLVEDPGTDAADRVDGEDDGPGRRESRPFRPGEHPPAPADSPHAAATAEAVIAVPGVTRLAPVLGTGPAGDGEGAVRATDRPLPGGAPLQERHVLVQLAVAEGSRALDVARAVRQAAAKSAAWDAPEETGPVTVAVLISAIDPAGGPGGRLSAQTEGERGGEPGRQPGGPAGQQPGTWKTPGSSRR